MERGTWNEGLIIRWCASEGSSAKRSMRARMLCASQRHEADFDAPVQCGCNAIEHRKGVSLVIRIFEPSASSSAHDGHWSSACESSVTIRKWLLVVWLSFEACKPAVAAKLVSFHDRDRPAAGQRTGAEF